MWEIPEDAVGVVLPSGTHLDLLRINARLITHVAWTFQENQETLWYRAPRMPVWGNHGKEQRVTLRGLAERPFWQVVFHTYSPVSAFQISVRDDAVLTGSEDTFYEDFVQSKLML